MHESPNILANIEAFGEEVLLKINSIQIDAVFANQLRIKFDVYTRDGLYDKLISLGFYQVIPQDLMVNVKLPAGHIDVYQVEILPNHGD